MGKSLLQHLHSLLDYLDAVEFDENIDKVDIIGDVRERVSRSVGAVVQCVTVRNFVIPIDESTETDKFLMSIRGESAPYAV